jgi:hypothetical protein
MFFVFAMKDLKRVYLQGKKRLPGSKEPGSL